MTARPSQLVICSKSTWMPAIRREHALTGLASAAGHPVEFLERPLDVRALGSVGSGRRWAGALAGRDRWSPSSGVVVTPTATVVPGHRSLAAERTNAALLRRRVERVIKPGATVVAATPWLWPAIGPLRGVRRVFECDDDWSSLIPERAGAFRALHARIAREADAVIAVNPAAQELFEGREVTIVRNGVVPALIDAERAVEPDERRLIYVGTLSPRFDIPLVRAVLDRLPTWRLHLYGQCQYPGEGTQPGAELRALLRERTSQVRWHGIVARDRLAEVLDSATVGLLPNRREASGGQDAMKLYDYSARGLPVVSTRWTDDLAAMGPPGLELADSADDMAAAILHVGRMDPTAVEERRAWATMHAWPQRWPTWRAALFGEA